MFHLDFWEGSKEDPHKLNWWEAFSLSVTRPLNEKPDQHWQMGIRFQKGPVFNAWAPRFYGFLFRETQCASQSPEMWILGSSAWNDSTLIHLKKGFCLDLAHLQEWMGPSLYKYSMSFPFISCLSTLAFSVNLEHGPLIIRSTFVHLKSHSSKWKTSYRKDLTSFKIKLFVACVKYTYGVFTHLSFNSIKREETHNDCKELRISLSEQIIVVEELTLY